MEKSFTVFTAQKSFTVSILKYLITMNKLMFLKFFNNSSYKLNLIMALNFHVYMRASLMFLPATKLIYNIIQKSKNMDNRIKNKINLSYIFLQLRSWRFVSENSIMFLYLFEHGYLIGAFLRFSSFFFLASDAKKCYKFDLSVCVSVGS